MSKIVKLMLIIAVTFLFGQWFYALADNVSEVIGYDFFGLEDILGEHLCQAILFYGTWYVVVPLSALIYSGIWRQIVVVGADSSKGKNTH